MKFPLVFILLSLVFYSGIAISRDSARELSKLIGYTIVDSGSVSEVITKNYSDKYLKLYSGSIFKVNSLILDPLVMTDVIIFAKKLPDSLTEKYKGKLPENMFFSYKMLIDNEIIDVTLQ